MPIQAIATGAARVGKVASRANRARRGVQRASRNARRRTRSRHGAQPQHPRRSTKTTPEQIRQSTIAVRDRSRRVMTAVFITSSLSFLLAFQLIIGISFLVAAGFFQYTLIELLIDNFGVAYASAEILLGGLWFILMILGVGFMLYAWVMFKIRIISSSSTLQRVMFMLCFTLHVAPFANAVFPWVLLWVWTMAFTRD